MCGRGDCDGVGGFLVIVYLFSSYCWSTVPSAEVGGALSDAQLSALTASRVHYYSNTQGQSYHKAALLIANVDLCFLICV